MEKWEKNHHSGENSRGGTGTDCVLSTSTGTGTHALFLPVFIFGHNLVICNPI